MNNKNLSKSFATILKENKTVALNQVAKDWKEAIKLAVDLLVKAKIATPAYTDAIIAATEEFGPYYLVADNVAMPHAKTGAYNLNNGFSLLTLKTPVDFKGDKIQVLICLSSVSADFHVATALPQIAALFDDPQMGNKIADCQNEKQLYDLISNIDFLKYIN